MSSEQQKKPLTPRWTPLKSHPVQNALWTTQARFCTVPAGRRSGKTEISKRRLIKCALQFMRNPHKIWHKRTLFAGAPTRDQAKRIYWEDLKSMIPKRYQWKRPSESNLIIYMRQGEVQVELHVLGLDKPERIEGSPWDGGVLDEFANMRPNAWDANVRPALADRKGWCWLIGVPEGRNHYYDLDKMAQACTTGEWASFTWKSADILSPDEVESARQMMDELTFLQEFEASFVTFSGRAYYPFDSRVHTMNQYCYDNTKPLIFCFDFNVSPGVAVVCQEHVIPGQYEIRTMGTQSPILQRQPVVGTWCIGEVHIPQNSNTPAVCRKLCQDWAEHMGEIHVYGDATGGASGTAKLDGSDWDLIKKSLYRVFGSERVFFRVPNSNPPERSRVNAVNSRLMSGSGIVRMIVDPSRCPNLVKDLEGVRVLEGGSGEIDKKADMRLSHISDALGYYIVKEFPIAGNSISRAELLNRY